MDRRWVRALVSLPISLAGGWGTFTCDWPCAAGTIVAIVEEEFGLIGHERDATVARVAKVVAVARAEHREFSTSDEELARHVIRLAGSAAHLEELHAADLFLALGCIHNDPVAREEFERLLAESVKLALKRFRLDAPRVDEVFQRVRVRLLDANDSVPRLARYSGRGPLRAWIRTVAVRTASDFVRTASDSATDPDRVQEYADDMDLRDAAAGDSVRTALLHKLAPRLQEAVAAAMNGLTPRDRRLLGSFFRDRLSAKEIAAQYSVNSATVSRWLDAAREALAALVREEFLRRVNIAESEFDSVAHELRSYVDVSIASDGGSEPVEKA